MHLKKLEIHGFKSFADSIKLDFEPGITAIVGPNGCGKSNIIDAIRWCLGEMSAKSLRSNAMLDVVFNGSGSRPPQNMSEVTLTFDNTDKRLPIDYTDVSISRRLFRTGESEYYINKTQCRLRDIKELFLDTGMGEDGYSSLEQGKVEWILQAKPEERRELFEEAAGVSKYRARREEALRKLERVEIDLSRLADIVAVTGDQIRKLENAVSKAKTYQRVREELKTMEISDWLFQFKNQDQEIKDIQGRIETAQRSTEELNTQVHRLNAELSELRLMMTQTEEELLNANSALNAIDSDIKIGEERLNAARRRQAELEQQIVNLRESVQREEARVEELAKQKQDQEHSLNALNTEGARIELDYAESQKSFQAALLQLENKKREVKEGRDVILDRAQERARLQQQVGRFMSDVSRLESQAENMQKERVRIQAQLDETLKFVDAAASQRQGLETQVGIKSSELENVTAELHQLEQDETRLRKLSLEKSEALAQLKGQIRSIQDEQSEDPYLAGAQAISSASLPGILGTVGRLFQCAPSDRDLVAATLGEHLADVVAETAGDAERAIQFLQANERGRARVWILDQVAPATGADSVASFTTAMPLLQRLQCEDRFRPLLAHLCGTYLVQGFTVFGRGFINGGIDPSKWKSHTLHRLPELEKALDEHDGEKKTIDQDLASVESKQTGTVLRKESAAKELHELRIRLEMIRTDHDKALSRKALLEEEVQVVEIDLAQNQEERVKVRTLQEEISGRFDSLQAREKDDHDQLDLLQQELTEFQHVHAKTNADLSAKTERHNAFQEKVRWQQSVLDHTERELANLNLSIERHRGSLSRIDDEVVAAKTMQGDASQLIESSLTRRLEAANVCGAIQEKRVTLAEQIQASDSRLSAARKELSTGQETLQKELIAESTLKSRLESLVQKMQDQYELTFESAGQQFQAQQADTETLERMKKRVTNMGPINLAAPQEHAELVEKNTFLTTQQSDLLKAKDDLRQVITKINATTREHFRETFHKVRENFRALYSKLFQGGEADLRFTDEADILSTGIDIYCQPPGKKLLHISLLSGGEKALTAIALLFAFFQVRPSPIALMDEVDAPLDEANVLRYVDMLKLFAQESQFLLISHNKRTMEVANNLYGVTMEELGVSKVLSARLQKAAAANHALPQRMGNTGPAAETAPAGRTAVETNQA